MGNGSSTPTPGHAAVPTLHPMELHSETRSLPQQVFGELSLPTSEQTLKEPSWITKRQGKTPEARGPRSASRATRPWGKRTINTECTGSVFKQYRVNEELQCYGPVWTGTRDQQRQELNCPRTKTAIQRLDLHERLEILSFGFLFLHGKYIKPK